MVKHNNAVPNVHLHKDWARRVKTWFNQPARAARRAAHRRVKAAGVFPRPVSGDLRPIVQCPTNMHNGRSRLGRGFTLQELRAAGLTKYSARQAGIAVDFRRTNANQGALNTNVQRLQLYKSKLVFLPHAWGTKPTAGAKPTELRQKVKEAIAKRHPRKNGRHVPPTAPRHAAPAKDQVTQVTVALPFVAVPHVDAPMVITEKMNKFHAYNAIVALRKKSRDNKHWTKKENMAAGGK